MGGGREGGKEGRGRREEGEGGRAEGENMKQLSCDLRTHDFALADCRESRNPPTIGTGVVACTHTLAFETAFES